MPGSGGLYGTQAIQSARARPGWARLPHAVDAGALVRECERVGVIIAAGDEWFPSEPSGPFIRLNFAAPDPAQVPGATQIIGTAIKGLLQR